MQKTCFARSQGDEPHERKSPGSSCQRAIDWHNDGRMMLAAGKQIAAALGDQKPVSTLHLFAPRRCVLSAREHMTQRTGRVDPPRDIASTQQADKGWYGCSIQPSRDGSTRSARGDMARRTWTASLSWSRASTSRRPGAGASGSQLSCGADDLCYVNTDLLRPRERFARRCAGAQTHARGPRADGVYRSSSTVMCTDNCEPW